MQGVEKDGEIHGSSQNPDNAIASVVTSDSFYEKLTESFEPYGLIPLFNVRETLLDLYLFFKEVTQRGGFHQVTKEGKWDEVAYSVQLKSSSSNVPNQLQKLYANFLYQIEQIYCHRSPGKRASPPGYPLIIGSSTEIKRKSLEIVSLASKNIDDNLCGMKRFNKKNYNTLGTASLIGEQKWYTQPLPVRKPKKKKGIVPKCRNAYQMFLNMECARLRSIHGHGVDGQNFREMALDTWRHLSDSERQPYIEESKKEKEKSTQDMKTRELQMEKTEAENKSSNAGNDSQMNLQPDAESSVLLNQSTASDQHTEMFRSAPNDAVLNSWDKYCGSHYMP